MVLFYHASRFNLLVECDDTSHNYSDLFLHARVSVYIAKANFTRVGRCFESSTDT